MEPTPRAKLREAWRAAVHGVAESDMTEWNELNWYSVSDSLPSDSCTHAQLPSPV